MQPYITAKIGGIDCNFENLNPSGFNRIWEWKLDSYKSTGTEKVPDLVIKNKTNVLSELPEWEKLPIFYEEISGFFRKSVYSCGDRGTLWVFTRNRKNVLLLMFYVSADWDEVTILADHTESQGCVAFEYISSIYQCAAIQHHLLPFHAVLMEQEGRGIAISAPSGIGKTTHARLWRKYKNALIINGDCSVCGRDRGEWQGYGIPWSGTSGEQINRQIPLRAMVVLKQDKVNRVQKIRKSAAFKELLPQIHYPSWDKELAGVMLEQLDDFLEDIPVFCLSCRPDQESVEILYDALKEAAG